MKKSLLAIALLMATAAYATNKPTPPSNAQPSLEQSISNNVTAKSVSGANASTSLIGGDSSFYVLPATAGGSLPPGMCQTSEYNHWNFILVGHNTGKSYTDMDCLRVLVQVQEFRAEAENAVKKQQVTTECRPVKRPKKGKILPPTNLKIIEDCKK